MSKRRVDIDTLDLTSDRYGYRKTSLKKIARLSGEDRKNLGYDYSQTLFSSNISRHIVRKNTVSNFIVYLNDWFVELLNTVKRVKNFKNFTVDKDYTYID